MDEIPYLLNPTIFESAKFSVEKFLKSLSYIKWCIGSLGLWNPFSLINFLKKHQSKSRMLPNTKSYRVMEQMTEMWTNFAKTG